MTEPSDRAREKARELLSGTHFSNPVDYMHLRDEIAAALDAAYRVPEGHVREGVTDRKVLGVLPITADGVIVGLGCEVWVRPGEVTSGAWHFNDASFYFLENQVCVRNAWSEEGMSATVSSCYSTRAAAEEARAK